MYVPTGRSVNVFEDPAATVKKYSVSVKVSSSDCRNLPALFFTENRKLPSTSLSLLSLATFATVRVPRSWMNLLTNWASDVSPLVTVASSEVVLPVDVNVYPSTEIEDVFSVTVYLPTGRFSKSVWEPASTVKNTSVVSKDVLSACRNCPLLFLTENSNVPDTLVSWLSWAVLFTLSVPTSWVKSFSSFTLVLPFFVTLPRTEYLLSSMLNV